VLHDGPAFAHSKSHVGQMFNKVLKDIVNRYKLFRGYRVHYLPGFDCHGTSVEDFYTADTSKSKIDELDLSITKRKEGQSTRALNEKEDAAMKVRKVCENGVKDSMML
jgi:isoleucyl-tRNA synthetase